MDEEELRYKIAEEVKREITIALENCACLGRDALNVGPGTMTTTYIERMTNMITNKIKKV